MSGTHYTALIAMAAFVTYLTRWPPMLIGRMVKVTPRLQNGLNYIPIGVFAAMVAPAIGLHKSAANGIDPAFLCAAAIAFVTAVLTKHPLWTMIAGVVSVALLRML